VGFFLVDLSVPVSNFFKQNIILDIQNQCNSTSINTIDRAETKMLIKIIDILGRESQEIKNKPLFYIYNDGTVEKRIILE
jgi:hypothetical protein